MLWLYMLLVLVVYSHSKKSRLFGSFVVYSHSNEIPNEFAVDVKERQDRFPTMYWLPILYERPYKARLIANSSSCTISNLLISCLTAIKAKVMKYCEIVYERSGKI